MWHKQTVVIKYICVFKVKSIFLNPIFIVAHNIYHWKCNYFSKCFFFLSVLTYNIPLHLMHLGDCILTAALRSFHKKNRKNFCFINIQKMPTHFKISFSFFFRKKNSIRLKCQWHFKKKKVEFHIALSNLSVQK